MRTHYRIIKYWGGDEEGYLYAIEKRGLLGGWNYDPYSITNDPAIVNELLDATLAGRRDGYVEVTRITST